jgi:hypothetical protein
MAFSCIDPNKIIILIIKICHYFIYTLRICQELPDLPKKLKEK